MKNTSLFFASVLLTLSLCLLPANRGAAQAKDPFAGDGGGGGARKKIANTAPAALEEVRFDVEFVDTPAPEAFQFIAMKMEELGADPLNIVYSKAAEAITLPTMTLRQITVILGSYFLKKPSMNSTTRIDNSCRQNITTAIRADTLANDLQLSTKAVECRLRRLRRKLKTRIHALDRQTNS